MKTIHILLVEDNAGDILLTREALDDADINYQLTIAKDGNEAIEVLNDQLKGLIVDKADLVLLDINLPKRNGHEVLKYIKNHEQLQKIPVVMLSTSSSGSDMDSCKKNRSNGYLLKPLEVSMLNSFFTMKSGSVN